MQIGFSNYMPTFSHRPGWDRQSFHGENMGLNLLRDSLACNYYDCFESQVKRAFSSLLASLFNVVVYISIWINNWECNRNVKQIFKKSIMLWNRLPKSLLLLTGMMAHLAGLAIVLGGMGHFHSTWWAWLSMFLVPFRNLWFHSIIPCSFHLFHRFT